MFKFLNTSPAVVTLLLLSLTACSSDSEKDSEKDSAGNESTSEIRTTLDPTRVGHYGYGAAATEAEIAGWDIDIRPDGMGLPEGSGSVEDGEWIYEEQCAECHGSFGEGVGRFPVLAGGEDTLRDSRPSKTIGSYWPYTSTLYDYIYRAMPFTQPESLSVDETYAVTAYVLYLNDLVEDDFTLNQDNLAAIKLPNQVNFGPDPRPDVANTRCMNACRDPEAIKILSEALPQETQEGGDRPAEEPGEVASNGESIYDQACKLCHETGLAGAPAVGDADHWQTRMDQGIEVMAAKAITGFTGDTGVMPAKGGFGYLSDEEVRAAVNYMVDTVQ